MTQALREGSTVGRYKIVTWIGESRDGAALLGLDPELERHVFIQVANPLFNRGMRRAAKIYAGLTHSIFCKAFDFGYEGDQAFLVLEAIGGFEVDQTPRPWDWKKAVKTIIELSEGLAELHKSGYVHTILSAKKGGLIFDVNGKVRISCLQHAQRIGADGYSIPASYRRDLFPSELQDGASEVTPAADIWSLGLVFLCLVSDEAIEEIATDPGTAISRLEGRLPGDLLAFCERWLSEDFVNRPKSCEELVTILDSLQGSPTPIRIFISHSSQDRFEVEDLVVRPLESSGYKTWYSKNKIESAAEWERGILEGLRSCEWFLVVVSQSSLESSWVKDELYWAIEERPENIVPVVLDSTDPRDLHIRLGRLQSIDLNEESAIGKMFRVLQ